MKILDAIKTFFGIGTSSTTLSPVVPDDPCSADCVAAKGRLQAARTAIPALCDGIRVATDVANAAAAVLFSPAMAIAFAVAIAAWLLFGGLAGAAVVALIVLYVTLMAAYIAAMAVIRGLGALLGQRVSEFQDAFKDVTARCAIPPECLGDLSPFECRLA